MTSLHLLSAPLGDDPRGALVFAGDLLVFKAVAALHELCAVADELIANELGPDREEQFARVGELQQLFRNDQTAKRLFAIALESVGVDIERTYWDRLHLRVQPPRGLVAGRDSGTLGVHRDTWGSNVYAQTNWWTPIRPLSPERTIAIYPAYWERPLANDSADWDLEVVRAQARGDLRSPRVPLVPEPSEQVDRSSELRIVPEPGDLLCFSGAHLHASVPNTSPEPRFSLEIRTLLLDDLLRCRGAPNIDGRAPHVPLEWFRRIPDGAPLPPPPS
jgi:hypothetical protein